MAPPAERPPSEQGVEFQTLDAIAELQQQVAELAQRPLFVPQGNWWDVLGYPPVTIGGRFPAWLEIFAQSTNEVYLGCTDPTWHPTLRAQVMSDRLELTLRLNSAYTIWQRALFFDRQDSPR